jgi:hypothetical protein
VVLLARFTIHTGGALTPPTVRAPARVPVQLELISGDGRAHRVQLRTGRPHTLAVPAHGRAGTLLRDLRVGRYPLTVDGRRRGALVIGGAPGP